MCRMLNISLECSFVLELHDPAKRITFSSRRKICADMGLKQSRDYPLKSGNLFRGSLLLSLRSSLLPLECEHMKNTRRLAIRCRHLRAEREKSGGSDSDTAISQQSTAC